MLKNLAAFLIAPILIPAQIAFAQNSQPDLNQKLGMYSKPSVVRIKAGCYGRYEHSGIDKNTGQQSSKYYTSLNGNVGSGFFVNSNGYIATNANVVEIVDKVKNTPDGCKDLVADDIAKQIKEDFKKVDEKIVQKIKNSLNEESDNFQFYNYVLLPNTQDSFPFKVKEIGIPTGSQDVAIIKIETKNAPVLKLGNSDTVQLLDNVLVIGYPSAADLGDELKASSRFEASVNEGKVSSTKKKLKDNAPVLQIDVQAALGSSGSPVLNDRGEVVGMMMTLTGRDYGGTSIPFAIPTNTIQEYIRRSGTVNEQGRIDPLYRDGLELYWKEDYRAAKAKFEAVKGLFEQHSEIDQLIRDSQEKIADVSAKTDYTPWLLAIGAFLAGTTAVLLFINLRKRNVAGSTEIIESTEYLQEPTHEIQEPTVVEPVERAPSLQVVSGSVSNIYRPATVMSGLGTRSSTYLELRNPQGGVQRLNLQGERYQIGRDRDWSNIDLTEPAWNVLSWHHAVLKKEGQNYRIYDGDGTKLSTNRIWINNAPINPQEGHLLQDGDHLKIGLDPENQVTLIYKSPTSKESVA
ncbi:trypsin-like peptidase domain-containing protein [Nostoc sp. FACHB-152]|uniref:trypsin-like peptidase domain-containing protein n=1 Tax=unclassified Nostoc TaxID=2593658 RepID=UPI001687749A|nr:MULTISPECIES: trypsin-like peptidase domain-containing protein [unclassified Nostoc]MBD2450705.1 trypsin-like peptidase domain-containing protein [Nostoc sp. FACHB-152]MBD2471917.1 trypsin-like peptidase domain-containing protein [Nostoc sp. FACHB-145]